MADQYDPRGPHWLDKFVERRAVLADEARGGPGVVMRDALHDALARRRERYEVPAVQLPEVPE